MYRIEPTCTVHRDLWSHVLRLEDSACDMNKSLKL